MQKQPSEGFLKKDVMKNSAEFTRKHLRQNLFFGVSSEFCETCNITFFAEQHWTTASECSSINSSEENTVLVKETVNYDTKTKAYLFICAKSVIY